MPAYYYKLSEIGENAREELLQLVYQSTWNPTILYRDTGLEYGKTLAKILGKKDGGMQLNKIASFFKSLLKKLKIECDSDNTTRYIKKYDFERFYQNIDENELSSFLPKILYESSEKIKPEILISLDSPRQTISSNLNHELTQALWYLDYEDQENKFKTALKGQSKNLAFTFAAPCPVTQSWIFNRLLLKIARKDNRKIFTIDLESSNVRNNYNRFLVYLSELLNTSPDCDEISDRIHEIDSEMSIIIVIKNFRKRLEIQENIMTKFWTNLCTKTHEKNRLGRVVLFWVDECLLDYQCSIIKLDELREINQLTIEQWINEYSGLYPFLSNISICSFLSDSCDWKDPLLILDVICNQLKINKGIVNIQSLWEHKI